MQTIKANQVYQKLNDNSDTILINTLGPNSFQAKHIRGSINIPAGEIEDAAPRVLPDKDQEIIVHCSSKGCTASSSAAEKLTELGYKNVLDFEAGFTGWLNEGFELLRAE